MARFIDADDLSRRMYHEAFEVDSDMQKWDSGCWIRYKVFENCIAETPTANVRENKHGEWIEDKRGVFMCSECNNGFINQPTLMGKPMFKWCPCCGAEMTEVDHGN